MTRGSAWAVAETVIVSPWLCWELCRIPGHE